MQGWESEWHGVGWDPMGGDPWEPKRIPWEGTHGSGSPRDPMGGGPGPPMGGDPLGAQGIPWEGTLEAPSGSHSFLKLPFSRIRRKQKSKTTPMRSVSKSQYVCMLFLRYKFAVTRYQNIEKPLNKIHFGPIWPGHHPEFTRIPMTSY